MRTRSAHINSILPKGNCANTPQRKGCRVTTKQMPGNWGKYAHSLLKLYIVTLRQRVIEEKSSFIEYDNDIKELVFLPSSIAAILAFYHAY